MLRSLLVLLLLAHYLLVVGAGLVERPARAVERPFAYVHSSDCQLRHTLRLACFDDCNGVQYSVKKTGERMPFQQLLTSLKGLDTHCLPEAWVPADTTVFGLAESWVAPSGVGIPTGYHGEVELPPC